ncbi:hypothetical protein D3C85_339270 [compost metagenome]
MPADVFAPEQQFAAGVHEHRRMHRAAVLTERLKRADALTQTVEPFARWQRRAGQHLEVGQCLLHRFNTAQPATAGARHLPALLLEIPERTVGDGHLRVLRRPGAGQLQVIDVGGVLDDAAAEAKADDEVFQVGRCHQHHRLTDAVVGDRQRDFLSQRSAGRFLTG